MIEAPIHVAKTKLTELLRAVEAGERVIITRHGKPVAELTPPRAEAPRNTFSLERIAQRRREMGLPEQGGWISPDFDEPLPDEFWFTPDDFLEDDELGFETKPE